MVLWLAWELSYIRERKAWIAEHPGLVNPGSQSGQVLNITIKGDLNLVAGPPAPPKPPSPPATIPWCAALGDEPVTKILNLSFSDDDRATVVRLFPEAEVTPIMIPNFTTQYTVTPAGCNRKSRRRRWANPAQTGGTGSTT